MNPSIAYSSRAAPQKIEAGGLLVRLIMFLFFLSLPFLTVSFLLNSGWALISALVMVVSIIVRTALEDKTLQTELPGYVDYTQHTRYRLLLGVE